MIGVVGLSHLVGYHAIRGLCRMRYRPLWTQLGDTESEALAADSLYDWIHSMTIVDETASVCDIQLLVSIDIAVLFILLSI